MKLIQNQAPFMVSGSTDSVPRLLHNNYSSFFLLIDKEKEGSILYTIHVIMAFNWQWVIVTFTSFFQRGTLFDHVSSEHIYHRGLEGVDFKEFLLISFSLWKWKISLEVCWIYNFKNTLSSSQSQRFLYTGSEQWQGGSFRGLRREGVTLWAANRVACKRPPKQSSPPPLMGCPRSSAQKKGSSRAGFSQCRAPQHQENKPALSKHQQRQAKGRCRHSQTPLSVKAEDYWVVIDMFQEREN